MHVGFEEASGPSTFRRLHHRNHVLQFCEQLHPPRQTGIVLKPIVWVWLKDEPLPNISGVLLILLQSQPQNRQTETHQCLVGWIQGVTQGPWRCKICLANWPHRQSPYSKYKMCFGVSWAHRFSKATCLCCSIRD